MEVPGDRLYLSLRNSTASLSEVPVIAPLDSEVSGNEITYSTDRRIMISVYRN